MHINRRTADHLDFDRPCACPCRSVCFLATTVVAPLNAGHHSQVEWTGWAVAAYPSLPAIAFAVFTFANLAPRGLRHHLWCAQRGRAQGEGVGQRGVTKLPEVYPRGSLSHPSGRSAASLDCSQVRSIRLAARCLCCFATYCTRSPLAQVQGQVPSLPQGAQGDSPLHLVTTLRAA